MEKCNDNGSVLVRTINDEAIPMLVNGHRFKLYKEPHSKRELIEYFNKTMMVVEHVLAFTSPTHRRKENNNNNKDSSENLHKALESHHWVENHF